MKENNIPPMHWALGQIIKTHPESKNCKVDSQTQREKISTTGFLLPRITTMINLTVIAIRRNYFQPY